MNSGVWAAKLGIHTQVGIRLIYYYTRLLDKRRQGLSRRLLPRVVNANVG